MQNCNNMPKVIELTVEFDVIKVSCPGVWLCQDGRVSLTVHTLGTSYQTCLLPPVFPLPFRDVFFFRKRFQKSCALNNMCCLLKDETIYCELVQWCDDCSVGDRNILAQYLGSLNDVLFLPDSWTNDGVDLLMRRSKDFPGILSPKIEIATKVRIDEVWDNPGGPTPVLNSCSCLAEDEVARTKQVCHSAKYHRNKCFKRSKSRYGSACSVAAHSPIHVTSCVCPGLPKQSYKAPRLDRCQQYAVYNVQTKVEACPEFQRLSAQESSDVSRRSDTPNSTNESRSQRTILESRYVEQETSLPSCQNIRQKIKKIVRQSPIPCQCQICKKYYELFHSTKLV